jgi:hypothetical protein
MPLAGMAPAVFTSTLMKRFNFGGENFKFKRGAFRVNGWFLE